MAPPDFTQRFILIPQCTASNISPNVGMKYSIAMFGEAENIYLYIQLPETQEVSTVYSGCVSQSITVHSSPGCTFTRGQK